MAKWCSAHRALPEADEVEGLRARTARRGMKQMGNGESGTQARCVICRGRHAKRKIAGKDQEVRLAQSLDDERAVPRNMTAGHAWKANARSGTSVAANYREACRKVQSGNDIQTRAGRARVRRNPSLVGIACRVPTCPALPMSELQCEAEELLRIMVASIKTLKAKFWAIIPTPHSQFHI